MIAIKPFSLCAVITAYRPDQCFGVRFAQIAQACHALIVVDNTPGGHCFDPDTADFVVLQDGVNKGLGKALNQGIEYARALGATHVVLFDQDSSPDKALLAGLASHLSRPHRCVGPLLLDDQDVVGPGSGKDQPAMNERLREMTCLATSGMMFPVDEWSAATTFSEDLFLDFVDFEWCWRMRSRGWQFFKALDVPMPHRLGLAQRHLFGLVYHVPAPYRHYFQFRDTLRVVTRRGVPLYARVKLLGLLPLKLLVYPWLLDRGAERLAWMLHGVVDAVRNRGGVGAAAAKLCSKIAH